MFAQTDDLAREGVRDYSGAMKHEPIIRDEEEPGRVSFKEWLAAWNG